MLLKRSLLALFALVGCSVMAQTINDAFIEAGQVRTLTAGTEYTLDGFVFVEEGAELYIQAGTVIKALQTPTTGDNASALIVARGGKVFAYGTADAPIIFTSELDDLSNPNDVTWADRGLWGGVILLGNATTNRGVEGQIEGIPSGEIRAAYGGDDDEDSSGVMRYVSIRHGGAELGPGDEINGLTFGAVGSGTVIDHVEVFSNLDDGFEWFGGTVSTRYLISAFCGDDGFDYDEGWRGMNQFWFAIQGPDSAGRVGEHDGGTVQETAPPFATPYILNATYIGPGVDVIPQGDGSEAVYFRDNAGGVYQNAIITDYNGANNGKGVTVEDLDEGDDSRVRMEMGDLVLTNNLWWNIGNGNSLEGVTDQDFVAAHLAANNNWITSPFIRSISREADGNLDPRPSGGVAVNGASAPPSPVFDSVSYLGAFDSNEDGTWLEGWTALDDEGHLRKPTPRMIPHVTSLTGGFTTTFRFVNAGSGDADMTLSGYDITGIAVESTNVTVPAGGSMEMASTAVFTQEISHVGVSGSDDCQVFASYKVAEGAGASADLPDSTEVGSRWQIFQGEWDVVFDGLAIVNAGASAATVTLIHKLDGQEVASVTLTDSLAPHAKALSAFGEFSSAPGSVIEVRSSQPAAVVFLRGTAPGVSPGYLYVTIPAVLY